MSQDRCVCLRTGLPGSTSRAQFGPYEDQRWQGTWYFTGKQWLRGMWDPIKKEWAFYQRGRFELYTLKTPQDLKLTSEDVGQMLESFGVVQLPQVPVWWSSYHWEVPESPLVIMAGAELPARREPVAVTTRFLWLASCSFLNPSDAYRVSGFGTSS